MSYDENQKKLRDLALLCLSEHKLTDEDLALISGNSRELSGYLHRLASSVSTDVDREIRSRARRKELEALSDEELNDRIDKIQRRRNEVLDSDIGDDLSDSFYELPSIDSDAYLIPLILKSREDSQVVA